MASSSERWIVACDVCGAGGAIGPVAADERDPGARDAWCEACQRAQRLAAGATHAGCGRCGGPLSTESPRFLEAWGRIQNVTAVVAAMDGDPAPLRALLPERPRFLADLDPPEPASGDAPDAAAALAGLAAGEFTRARPGLVAWTASHPEEARAWVARAIVEERLGDATSAETSWSRAIDAGESTRSRLARGALRAKRAAWDEAAGDLARAGDGREARWNRAALRVARAVEITPGLPAAELLESARAEAGPPSEYWSDFTVGRLLWTLLVERAAGRARAGAPACPDERVLRAAALEFEHDTFWDRAMVLAGYSGLGMAADAESVGGPLAGALLDELEAEPFLRARRAEPIREAVRAAHAALGRGERPNTRQFLQSLLDREDLRHYAVPCAACESGVLRAEAIEEPGGGNAPPIR